MAERRRVRGVKASRQKLEAVMAAKGFTTQIQLAKSIAEKEQLSTPPKDLVNKIFREQPVAFRNLARVADVLEVEVHTLILAAADRSVVRLVKDQNIDDNTTKLWPDVSTSDMGDSGTLPPDESDNDEIVAANDGLLASLLRQPRKLTLLLASVGLLVVFVGVLLWPMAQWHSEQRPNEHFSSLVPAIGPTRVIVVADNPLRDLGAQFVDQTHAQDSINAVLVDDTEALSMTDNAVIDLWDAHAVLRLQHIGAKHYRGFTITLASPRQSIVVAQQVYHPEAHNPRAQTLVSTLLTRLTKSFAGDALALDAFTTQRAFSAYVEGIDQAYSSYNLPHYQQALASIDQALAIDPDYSLAFAESCRIKTYMSWQGEEAAMLEGAAQDCATAEKLAPNHIAVVMAKAELLSRLGKKDTALTMIDAALTSAPFNADVLSLLAELSLQVWSSDADSGVDDELIPVYISQALRLSAKNWRAYNTLGNYYFAKGNISAALANFKATSELVKQEVILSNLGIIQLCLGDLSGAKATYIDLIHNVENSALGYENLGTVFYFQHDYPSALDYKLTAIGKREAVTIHQIWADVGDVYWQLGQTDNAINAYQQALLLIDKDELLGNASPAQQVAKAYYQARLKQLGLTHLVFPDFAASMAQLLLYSENLSVKAKAHLAWLAQQFAAPEVAQELWLALEDRCPVYMLSPNKE